MPQLEEITDLPPDAVELLEAVGYLDTHDLLEANNEELLEELLKANKALEIMSKNPGKDTVEAWQDLIRSFAADAPTEDEPDVDEAEAQEDETEAEAEIQSSSNEDVAEAGDDAEAEDETEQESPEEDPTGGEDRDAHAIDIDPGLVNFEEDPEVRDMLAVSPEATPLHPSLIRRHKLAVADIPEGMLLTQCKGEVEINVMTNARLAQAQKREADIKRTGLMISRIRSFEEAESSDHHVKPLDKGEVRETVAVSEGLNAGLKPESRRFVRGVLHPEPVRVRVSAFFAVLVEIMLVANLVGIPWALFHEYSSGDSMFWLVIGLSSGLFLSALCYLFWGISARCRVCGQRWFAPKKCLKNKKAHHIPVVGYIFPTALHAMFFKWFYCTYCGTAVRLKK